MAGKEQEQQRAAVPRSVESLGWLSQSGVQPKKQRLIEGAARRRRGGALRARLVAQRRRAQGPARRGGALVAQLPGHRPRQACLLACLLGAGVSAGSLVAMKSELYKVQQEQQAVKEGRLDPEELRQVGGARRVVGGVQGGLGRRTALAGAVVRS